MSHLSRLASFICYLLLVIILAACTASPQGVEVAPPIVITVVVTPTSVGTRVPGATPPPTSLPGTQPATQVAATPAYPAPFQNNVSAVYQDFEKGVMIYLADRQAIWVFIDAVYDAQGEVVPTRNHGLWLAFPDTFQEGDPETDPTLTPPSGFQQPKRGFGKVWRENQNVRDALGWGLDFERPYSALVTDYSIGDFDGQGNYTPRSFIHTVTALDGSLIHIDEDTGYWSKP